MSERGERVEVVVEEALFVGVVLNFFIIKLVAKVLRRRVRLGLLSALVGEIVALFSPLFVIHTALKVLLTFLTCLLMLVISFEFGSWKSFALLIGVFVLATFIFGGACEALKSLVGQFPLFIIAIVGAVIYVGCVIIHKIIFRRARRDSFVYKVKIRDKGTEVLEEGYFDSGNVLYDCVFGQPIMLVTFDVFKKIYQHVKLTSFITRKIDLSSIKNGHYIKINSVGQGGNMLVFSVDEVVVGEDKSYKNAMLGLSFSGFEKSFGKNILLHCDMV